MLFFIVDGMLRFENGAKVRLKKRYEEYFPEFVGQEFVVVASESTNAPTLNDVICIRDDDGHRHWVSSQYFEEV